MLSTDEIIQALSESIELGYAKAWHLSGTEPPKEYKGMPPREKIKHPWGAYFDLTPEGMAVHLADYPGWPFDRSVLHPATSSYRELAEQSRRSHDAAEKGDPAAVVVEAAKEIDRLAGEFWGLTKAELEGMRVQTSVQTPEEDQAVEEPD